MNATPEKAVSDTEERELIGHRLQASRKYLGFTQEEVADYLGIPRSALSEMEKGSRKVEALELKKMAKLYKQPTSYFTGEDATAAELPPDVAHMARQAASLSNGDRRELARFADFLRSRSETKGS